MPTTPATTVRLPPEDRERLERIASYDGKRFGMTSPASHSAVMRRLLRDEDERLSGEDGYQDARR